MGKIMDLEIDVSKKTERVSELPDFVVVPLDEEDALVACPTVRGRCGNSAIVNFRTWIEASPSLGRPCTYCCKTSNIPRDEWGNVRWTEEIPDGES